MFHPLPAERQCFLYGWPALQAIEAIYGAIAKAVPSAVPAMSGGCISSLVHWGTREATGEPWADGSPHPCGPGRCQDTGGDGGTMLHISESATQFSPIEVSRSRAIPGGGRRRSEARHRFLRSRAEYRGGAGVDFHFRMLEDTYVTTAVERTRNAPWAKALKGMRAAGSSQQRRGNHRSGMAA